MQTLKHWITHNWFLKIFSLILATMLWMAVAHETTSEIGMEVPIEYRNIPSQLEITGDAANAVQVRLRGSSNVIRGITPRDVATTIDLRGMTAGEKIVPLSPQSVKAPFGAEVVRVNPSNVRFNLERTLRKDVFVVPTVTGEPADGYEVGEVSVDPSKVQVEGPESRVITLDSIPTLPIRIDHRQTPAGQMVELDVPDPQVRLLRVSPVAVRVEIRKKN
jgi:YbbR domain-containing protein